MSFELRISFDGLYVLGVDKTAKAVHALLIRFGTESPITGATASGHSTHGSHAPGLDAAGTGHPKHIQRLYYDAAHAALDAGDRTEMTGHLYAVSMKDRFLELGSGGATTDLEKEIVDISRISQAKNLKKALVELDPGRGVAGRISLLAGKHRTIKQKAEFDVLPPVETNPITIATRVEWAVPIADDKITLEFRNIENGKVVDATHVLRPVPILEMNGMTPTKVEVVRLHVYSAPQADLPGAGVIASKPADTPLPHLEGTFRLFPGVTVPTIKAKKPRTGSTEQCTGFSAPVV